MAVLGQTAHEAERRDRFLVGQHRGGLVQDEDSSAEEQHLEDLDALLLGDGELADDGVGIDVETDFRRLRRDLPGCIAGAAHAQGVPAGEDDVLGDRETLHQLVVLVDHPDAEASRVGRRSDRGRPAVDRDGAFVRGVEPAGDIHQGRLAGAVLPEQGVDFAPIAGERRPLERRPAVEGLARADDF